MMDTKLDLRTPFKYSIIIGVFALVNILVIIFFMLQFTAPFTGDSEGYALTAQYFKGEGEPAVPRMLKPLMPFLIATSSYLFGLKDSFLFLNSLFYFLIGFLIFKIVRLLFNDNRQALIATILFLSAYPVLEYGITYMTDLAGWFFAVLSCYLTLIFLKQPNYKWLILNAIICLAGLLTKEYVALGILFFLICLFFIFKDNLKNKIKYFLVYTLILLVPFFAWLAYVYFKFNYTYYDWYLLSAAASRASNLKSQFFRVIGKSLFATFLLGWPFVFIALVKIKKIAKENRAIIWALIIPSFSFLLWQAASSRLFYVVGLLLSVLASWGIVYLTDWTRKRYVEILSILIILASNYFWFIFDDRLRSLINALFKITY